MILLIIFSLINILKRDRIDHVTKPNTLNIGFKRDYHFHLPFDTFLQ